MKRKITAGLLAAGILLAGCDRKKDAPFVFVPDPSPPVRVASPPVIQPILAALERGDRGLALTNFVEADWAARPLFVPGTTLGLSENDLKALPPAEQLAKSKELVPQMDVLRKLALSVAAAGREAAASGDSARAQKYFMALKQCGIAMDDFDRVALVQFLGRTMKRISNQETSRPGQGASHEQVAIAGGGKS